MHARDIQSEKIRFLYAGSLLLLIVGAMTAVLMVVLHWNLVPRASLLLWLAAMVMVLAGRAGLLVFFRRLPTRDEVLGAHWLWRFRLGTLASGLTWGVGAVLLCQSGNPVYEAFVAFAMAGISAAAITALAIDRLATLFFVIPLLAPLSVRFLLDPAELALTMGLIVLLFLLILAVIAARIEAYLEENVRLRLQAESQKRQIQTNELRWRFALEGSGQGLWDWEIEDWDRDTDRVFYSPRWKSMLGFAEDQIGSTLAEWKSRVHPEDLATVGGALKRHIDGESPFYETEHRIRCQDGGYKWILDRGQVIEQTPPGMPRRMIGVHIDISDRQFRDANFVERILAVLERTGIDPGLLDLELNESLLLQNPKGAVARMDALKAQGVRLTLDRFGSERSSLGALKNLPLDRLKLDRSLIRDLFADSRAAAIAKSVIALGDALGFEVTAVGVETEAQRRFLEAHACPSFQGYLFSQPLSLEELHAVRRNGGVLQTGL
ncbi:EAL domain-containing protein [uncultured Thiocystis sp.]|jgi:PAS domain S-box-containing protein|uniref:EAL domain-containing protein n=1 Tax=uncultured Thiocystis sp. TaxID=1202134 RepID=UPI0025F5BA23|nr:EAL domain-containing protein [uncultured Thiocystis sp.]